MKLSLEERDELQQSARKILSERYPIERVRELLDDQRGFDERVGAELAAMDWSPMAIPERLGGYGVAFSDAMVVMAEFGRAVVGGPYLPSAVIAAGALAMSPNESAASSLVPSLLDGSAIATVAIAGPKGHYSVAGLGVVASASGAGFTLSGQAAFVVEGHVATHFVVFARSESGVVAAVVARDAAGVTVDPTPLVDQTRRVATIGFDGVVVTADALLVEPSAGGELLGRVTELGAICAAIDSFGLAEIVLHRTAEYAKQRQQFGRSIGSFQAIKHKLADAVLLVETSRVALDHAVAAVTLEPGAADPEVTIRVSGAKSYVCDSAAKICQEAVQIHGGIGFTWEQDTHLYLKRALVNQSLFGQSTWHLDRVADAVLPAARVGIR